VRAISPDGNYVVGQAASALRQTFAWNVYSGNVIINMGSSMGAAPSGSLDGEVWGDTSYTTQGSAIVSLSAYGSVAEGWTNIGNAARFGILWTEKEECFFPKKDTL